MKKILALLGISMLLVLFSLNVVAAPTCGPNACTFTDGTKVSVLDLTIGDKNQDASNPDHDNGPVMVQKQASFAFTLSNLTAGTSVDFVLDGSDANSIVIANSKYT